jgi:hypothetical protein
MAPKNKIKIDSFTVDKVRPQDLNTILKLAIKAQSSFGISDKSSPSLFLRQISELVKKNINYSFVFRGPLNKVFAAFIIRPETNISAELNLVLSDPNIIQTKEMYDEFYNILNSSKFKMFFIKVLKKRKKLDAYVRYLNIYGFSEVLDENDEYLTLSFKKA